MANKFRAAAKKVTGGSEVIAGLEKIENGLLITAYPNGFTINGADLINGIDQDTGESKQFVCSLLRRIPQSMQAVVCSLLKW